MVRVEETRACCRPLPILRACLTTADTLCRMEEIRVKRRSDDDDCTPSYQLLVL